MGCDLLNLNAYRGNHEKASDGWQKVVVEATKISPNTATLTTTFVQAFQRLYGLSRTRSDHDGLGWTAGVSIRDPVQDTVNRCGWD